VVAVTVLSLVLRKRYVFGYWISSNLWYYNYHKSIWLSSVKLLYRSRRYENLGRKYYLDDFSLTHYLRHIMPDSLVEYKKVLLHHLLP